MKKGVLVTAAILAVSCVQAARKPDSIKATPCEAAFDRAGQEFTLTSERHRSLLSIRKGYEYIQRVFPGEVAALLSKDKPACQRARDFADVEKDLKVKLETLSQTAKLLDEREVHYSELAQTEMMTDPDFVRKAICVLNCGSIKGDQCAEKCSVNEKFIELLAANDLFMRLFKSCAPQVNDFHRELELNLPQWSRMLKTSLWPGYHELTLEAQSARLALHEVRAQLKAEKQSEGLRNCEIPFPKWKAHARQMVDTVTGPGGRGSAFYISASDGVRVVTADHIYNDKDFWGEGAKQPLIFSGLGLRRLNRVEIMREMTPEPGMYSRDEDIIQSKIAEARPAFELAPSYAIPKSGQSFYLVGYPQVKDYRFTVYRCTFYGFGASKIPYSKAMVYVLRCPSVDGHIAGMSGGPVLDESGKVWGLITDHNPFLARVYVSPLSATPEKEVRMGLQQDFLTEHCLLKNEFVPSSCRVGPAQEEIN